MDRLLNFLFLYLLIGIFVFYSPLETQLMLITGFLFAFIIGWSSFFLNWLTLDGARTAILIGTAIFGLGGLYMAGLLLLFFVTGSLLSLIPLRPDVRSRRETGPRRTGIQVWSNSFWLVTALLLWYLGGQSVWLAAALAALAAATADTWATELGSEHFAVPTWSPVTLQRVPSGSEGGISIPGTAAAAAGSALIAGAGGWFFSLHLDLFFIIFFAGFLGSLCDSWLGATIQDGKPVRVRFPWRTVTVSWDNNMVNWVSGGFASLAALILIGILI